MANNSVIRLQENRPEKEFDRSIATTLARLPWSNAPDRASHRFDLHPEGFFQAHAAGVRVSEGTSDDSFSHVSILSIRLTYGTRGDEPRMAEALHRNW